MNTQSGKITHNAKLNHNGQLQRFLRSIPQSTVVFEMSGTWWLIDLLEELGHDIKALHPQGVRLIAQSCKKTDKNDAETLAHIARLGPCPCVWLPPKELRSLRALLRFRIFCVRRCTSIKNRIHALLRANGWQYPPITECPRHPSNPCVPSAAALPREGGAHARRRSSPHGTRRGRERDRLDPGARISPLPEKPTPRHIRRRRPVACSASRRI